MGKVGGLRGFWRAITAVTVMLTALVLLPPTAAQAFPENAETTNQDQSGCGLCHNYSGDLRNVFPDGCTACHTLDDNGDFPFINRASPYSGKGPHGTYNASTSRCPICHTLHDAPSGNKLLPGETVKATCFTCHDGTAGYGVYGTIAARGLTVGGGHSVEATGVVPGGDPSTGGSLEVSFRGASATLTCSDCHSPHGTGTVAKFTGERLRLRTNHQNALSDHLLKQRPTGSAVSVQAYGSDWCAACHAGRTSGSMAMNHPVDSSTESSSPYVYQNLPVYYQNFGNPSTMTGLSGVGDVTVGGVRHGPDDGYGPTYLGSWAFLMGYPRVALQVGHGPICQQCHEDSRFAGALSSDGAAAIFPANTYQPPNKNADGLYTDPTPPNPRFQNFPHETENTAMLVETDDNLCLNCHPVTQLP